jgi:putative PIG3 family NAD(P)H quinone oxidoreductase
MRAITFDCPGNEDVLRISDLPDPSPDENEILIDVYAAGINRADLLQRRGLYPPPPGTSDILGLECAGIVTDTGPAVESFRRGDRVMALLPGGGYAERVSVHEGSVLPMPASMSFHDAAAIPETHLTAFLNLFLIGGIDAGDRALVHGGSGGVGTSAIRLCNEMGVTIFVTAGGDERCRRCEELGADAAIDYRSEDFVARVGELTGQSGVEVVVDPVGAPYLEQDLSILSPEGRLVLIGLMGGRRAEIDLSTLLRGRISIIGSTLRSRSAEEKAIIVEAFIDELSEALSQRRIDPVVHEIIPLEEASRAHRMMEKGEHFGKIVLEVQSSRGSS